MTTFSMRGIVVTGVLMFASAASAYAQTPPNPFPMPPPPPARPAPAAAPKTPPLPAAPQGGTETAATSRSLIEAATALRASRFSEASLRAVGGLTPRMSFPVAGASIPLEGGGDASAPRLALGPNGGAAVLVKLPATTAGLGDPDPKRDPAYALATATGTRIKVWAVYTDIPSDAVLSRRMIAAFAGIGPPLLTFDPTFTPGPGVGPGRYMLK